MTVEEAKKKICPINSMTMAICAPHTSREGMPHIILGTLCIASACMMFRFFPDAKLILPNGMIVIVDERDADLLKAGGWGWAGRYVKNKVGYLHRAVITKHHGEIPPGFVIDHRDGDPLNNRLGNLRTCEQRENCLNSKGRGGKSRFKGVFKDRKGRWSAQITTKGTRKCLGTFDTEEEAAKIYDEAAKERADEFSRLNFQSPVDNGRHGYCGLSRRAA